MNAQLGERDIGSWLSCCAFNWTINAIVRPTSSIISITRARKFTTSTFVVSHTTKHWTLRPHRHRMATTRPTPASATRLHLVTTTLSSTFHDLFPYGECCQRRGGEPSLSVRPSSLDAMPRATTTIALVIRTSGCMDMTRDPFIFYVVVGRGRPYWRPTKVSPHVSSRHKGRVDFPSRKQSCYDFSLFSRPFLYFNDVNVS